MSIHDGANRQVHTSSVEQNQTKVLHYPKNILVKRILRFIHMTAGVIGSVIILMMSITGLLLNHQALLGFSSAAQLRLQKFIFALHTGSIGNTSFVWLTDLGAICMIVLSITGLWMWVNIAIRKTHTIIKKGKIQ